MQLDRPWVQIRAREPLEVFDLALVVVRRRPLAIVASAAVGIVPFAVLNRALMMAWPALEFWWPLLLVLEAPLATAPLTVLLGGLMFGERPGARRMASDLIQGAPALIFYAGIVRGLVLVSLLLLPFLADRLAYLDEVILLERCRWSRVMDRGATLGRGVGGEALTRGLVQLLFAGILMGMGWWALPKFVESLTDRWTPSRPEPPLTVIGVHLAAWVALAFFGVVRFLSYIDQRIKIEGWEVELRLRAAGAMMEDDRRW